MANTSIASDPSAPLPAVIAATVPTAAALATSELRYRRLFETAKDGILILDAGTGVVVDVNPFLLEMLSYAYADVVGKAIWELGFLKDAIASRDRFIELQRQEYVRYENLPLETAAGLRRDVEFVSNVYLVGEQKVIQCNIRDITERVRAESRQALATRVLAILNRDGDTPRIVGDILQEIKAITGVQAVGIRLRQGDDFPYFAQDGFSTDFQAAENLLTAGDGAGSVCRNADGSVRLECTCGLVVSGKTDPLNPLFTPGGSFWTNDSLPLLDLPADQDPRLQPRNRCIHDGFRSVALISLRSAAEIIGVLQLNDRRPNRFTLEMVQYFEGLGASIAVALTRQRAEQALAASELRYRGQAEALQASQQIIEGILNAMPVSVFWKDKDLCFLGCNLAFARDAGFADPQDIVGKDDRQMSWREQAETYRADDRSVIESGCPRLLIEETQSGPAGDSITLLTSKIPLRNAQGVISGVLGTYMDITAHKRAEQALQESTVFLDTLLQAIPVPVFYKDIEGRYTGCNRAFEAFYGTARAELLGKTVFDIAPRELAELYQAEDLELFRDGGVQVYDAKMRGAHGVLHDVVFHKAALLDAAGKVVGAIGVILDITDRVRAEEAHARLATAVEQSAEAIEITDTAGAILYANPAFERITGYSRAEVVGQNPRFLKSGKQDAEFYRRMWDVLGRGAVWSGHFTNKRKDGTLYEEEASISPVRDASGTVLNYVAVKRDVTHEVDLEKQLRQAQKMEAVGRLAGGVAHDFNNLLMGIMNYVELCRDQIDAGHPIREYLEEIMRDAQRSAEITRQLLAFARKQIIAPRVLDLNDAVAGMLKLLRRLIGEDISLAWLPGAELSPVKLDPSQLDQILANLCINARDAIGGVGKVTLETGSIVIDAAGGASHAGVAPGAYVSLAVSDDGCGMDRATLAQIFEPFFTTKGIGKGTGLGLATVYGIVTQNNGFIYAYSEPGQGTTFRIYLPQVAAAASASAVDSPAAVPPGRGETVLVVEDEKSLRVTCSLFLKALGYSVLAAETPGEALLLAERHAGDIRLLLTDVVMPGMDGRQLAQRLGASRPGMTVLFMSGYTADVIAQRGVLEKGMAFIAKPFSRDDLARRVHELLLVAEEHRPTNTALAEGR